MTLRQYLFMMVFATILCWIAWGIIIFNVDPTQSGLVGFVFFYTSLLFALIGTNSLVIFGCYQAFSRQNVPMYRYVKYSFRDALVISGVLVLLLVLQASRYVQLWSSILLMIVGILAVVFFEQVSHSERKSYLEQ